MIWLAVNASCFFFTFSQKKKKNKKTKPEKNRAPIPEFLIAG